MIFTASDLTIRTLAIVRHHDNEITLSKDEIKEIILEVHAKSRNAKHPELKCFSLCMKKYLENTNKNEIYRFIMLAIQDLAFNHENILFSELEEMTKQLKKIGEK